MSAPVAPVNPKIPVVVSQFQTGLFRCHADVMVCCFGLCCPCVVYGDNHNRVHGSGFVPRCLLYCFCCWAARCIFGARTRTAIRLKYALAEAPCSDFCVHCWCPACALCQEARELRHQGTAYLSDMQAGQQAQPGALGQGVLPQHQQQGMFPQHQQQHQQQQQQQLPHMLGQAGAMAPPPHGMGMGTQPPQQQMMMQQQQFGQQPGVGRFAAAPMGHPGAMGGTPSTAPQGSMPGTPPYGMHSTPGSSPYPAGTASQASSPYPQTSTAASSPYPHSGAVPFPPYQQSLAGSPQYPAPPYQQPPGMRPAGT